jgi:hypothetical protein
MESGKVGRWNEELSVEKVALIENKVRKWCMESH